MVGQRIAAMAAPLPVVSHKLVLLGDTAVGKSCLVVRFCRGEFYDYQEPTIVRTRGEIEMAAQGEECGLRTRATAECYSVEGAHHAAPPARVSRAPLF